MSYRRLKSCASSTEFSYVILTVADTLSGQFPYIVASLPCKYRYSRSS